MTESVYNERAVIQRAAKGDRKAFAALMEAHREGVFRTVYFRILNFAGGSASEEALDITQEVFLRAFRAIGRWRPEAKFSTWLQRIALNLASNYCRDTARRGELAGDRATEAREEPEAYDETTPIVRSALRSLSVRQRQVFVMRHYNEMPLKEIAGATRCSVSAVKTHLARAVGKLRGVLGRKFAGEVF
jgi:RNA polymerase sigma-70 factor (ECF subfamily)